MDEEVEIFFPALAYNAQAVKSYAYLKTRTILLAKMIQGEDTGERIEAIDKKMDMEINPGVYGGPKGLEVVSIKGFGYDCMLFQKFQLSYAPEKMTTLEYYQAREALKEILASNKKSK